MIGLKLGSLFDGSGGFPLAGSMHGITPAWASEIEPFPIRVTKLRFPDMKHLGSVTDINGAEIEPVDIITFGSPCQDLSVAGKQLGIHEGQRSNLFFEAVRIIKEMRDATGSDEHIRPRFAVWENVPGAFSSNKGADFKAVLEALAGVMQDGLAIPRPKKWNHAGCVVGHGWSLAWRVYDAQYWGVPQRRKRIYLVADFASERAGEILFERESVSGDSSESGAAGKGTAADAEGSVGGSSEPICLNFQGNKGRCCTTQDGTAYSLNAMHGHDVHVIADRVRCLNPWDCQSKRQHDVSGCYPTLQAYNGGGGRCDGVCYALDSLSSNSMKSKNPHSGFHEEQIARTLDTRPDPTCNQGGNVIVEPVYALQGNGIDRADTAGCNGCGWREDEMYTLNTIDRPALCYCVDCRNGVLDEEKTHTLQAKANGGISLNCTPSVVYDARGNGDGATSPTLTGDHQNRVTDYTALCIGNGQMNNISMKPIANTLDTMDDQQKVMYESDKPHRKYIVRRLTPTECARLQGFPDEWCEGLGGSDSAIYKAYGNGLALPCAYDVLRRIAKEHDKTTL